MGTYSYYAEMSSKLNNADASLDEIKSWFPKFQTQQYNPTYVDVSKPTLRSNDQVLDELGLDKDEYSVESLNNKLDKATYNAWDNLKDSLTSARNKTILAGVESFRSMQDTLNDRYSQGIELGISKSMYDVNLLSSMLGTSQANQQMLQDIDTQISTVSPKLTESLLSNKQKAQESYNELQESISKYAEQLYKADIKRQESEQKYNKTVTQAANKYAQSTYNLEEIYNINVGKLALSIYNNNQQAKALIDKASKVASTADEVAQAYVQAAQQRAQATVASATYRGYTVYEKSTDYSDILKQYFKNNGTIKDADSFVNSLKSIKAIL